MVPLLYQGGKFCMCAPLDKEGLGEIWSHPEQNSDDNFTPLWGGDAEGKGGWLHQTSHSEPNEIMSDDPEISPLNKGDTAKPRGFEQSQETPIQESNPEDDEDFKKRAKIFKTF